MDANCVLCTIGLGMPEFEILSVVALLEDLPERGLRRGQVGTVVEVLGRGVYEVEFSDDTAEAAVRASQLLQLHHQPDHQAA